MECTDDCVTLLQDGTTPTLLRDGTTPASKRRKTASGQLPARFFAIERVSKDLSMRHGFVVMGACGRMPNSLESAPDLAEQLRAVAEIASRIPLARERLWCDVLHGKAFGAL